MGIAAKDHFGYFKRGIIRIANKRGVYKFEFKKRKYKPFNWRSKLKPGQKTWKPV